MNVDNDILSR